MSHPSNLIFELLQFNNSITQVDSSESVVQHYAESYSKEIYFFATLGPADESTWIDPNFMKNDPRCRALTKYTKFNSPRCTNNSTPSNDLFCRVHVLHPPEWIFDDNGDCIRNPGRKRG